MKKKITIISIISFLILGILITDFTNNTKSSKSNTYQTIQTQADFIKTYDNYDELISDSELIAFGSVNNLESYMDNSQIVSKFNFKIDSIEKGDANVNETVYVKSNGGKITFLDYLKVNEEYLKIETSPEYIDKEKQLHGNKYVESIFEGVPNVQNGDQLVLFLSKSDNNDYYYIVGSSFFWKILL